MCLNITDYGDKQPRRPARRPLRFEAQIGHRRRRKRDAPSRSAGLASQTARVERVPIEREISVAPEIRTEGQVTIIPIIEERLIVEKRLVLVEEIRVTLADTVEDIDVPVELRTQRALIESDKH